MEVDWTKNVKQWAIASWAGRYTSSMCMTQPMQAEFFAPVNRCHRLMVAFT